MQFEVASPCTPLLDDFPFTPRIMKSFLSPLLLLITLTLASCAGRATVQRTPLQGAMGISLPAQHLAFVLPTGWRELKTPPSNTVFAADADGGRLRLVVAGPLGARDGTSKHVLVADPAYQLGTQRTLQQEGGFSKIDRAELAPVAGVNAFHCAASTRSKSILQVHVPQSNKLWLLTFYSTNQTASKVTSVQQIVRSFQFTP